MKPDRPAASGNGNLPHASVSAQAYVELAKAAVRANDGNGFVIERNPRSKQWRAWIAYFSRMEWQAHDKQGRPYTVNRGKVYETMQAITVPTAWPLEFDASAPAPRSVAPGDMPIGPERKRELAAMLRSLVANWGTGARAPSPSWSNMTPAAAAAKLQTIANDNPVQVSTPELAAYLARMREGPGGEESSG